MSVPSLVAKEPPKDAGRVLGELGEPEERREGKTVWGPVFKAELEDILKHDTQ